MSSVDDINDDHSAGTSSYQNKIILLKFCATCIPILASTGLTTVASNRKHEPTHFPSLHRRWVDGNPLVVSRWWVKKSSTLGYVAFKFRCEKQIVQLNTFCMIYVTRIALNGIATEPTYVNESHSQWWIAYENTTGLKWQLWLHLANISYILDPKNTRLKLDDSESS